MSEKFQKKYRISRSLEIRKIRAHGERFTVRSFQITRLKSEKGPRLVIAITRRAGGSVARNRVKRKLRDLFRKNKDLLGSYDYFFFINRPVGPLDEPAWQEIVGRIKTWIVGRRNEHIG